MKAVKRIMAALLTAFMIAGLMAPAAAEAASVPTIAGGLHFYTWDSKVETTCYLSVKKQSVQKFEYRVYYNSGRLKKSGSCTGTKYIDPDGANQLVKIEGLTSRACNTVSVRVMKGGKWSRWSSHFQIVPYNRTSTLKVYDDDVKVRIGWGAITGVSYYEVYLSTQKTGGYVKVKTTTGKACTLTRFNGLPFASGKRYYYRIVAVKKVGTKVVRSSGDLSILCHGSFVSTYEF